MSPEDIAWLHDYESRQEQANRHRVDVGASKSKTRKESYNVEETEAAAIGTGSAAEVAAAAALTREEGRRLDSIVDRGINALVRAVETYEKVATTLLRERQEDAKVHRSLLESVREHFIARTQAEGDLIRKDAEGDPNSKLAEQLLPLVVAQLTPAEQTPVNSKPKKRDQGDADQA